MEERDFAKIDDAHNERMLGVASFSVIVHAALSLQMGGNAAVSLQTGGTVRVPRVHRRVAESATMQFANLPNPFAKRPSTAPPREEEVDTRTPERRRFEDKQDGFLFFQAATPKTGVQPGLPDLLSKDDLARAPEVGLVPKAIIGVGTIIFLWLVVTLLIS